MTAKNVDLFEKYIEWRDTAEESRVPQLKKDFARENGVTVATLINWDNKLSEFTTEGKVVNYLKLLEKMVFGRRVPSIKAVELYGKCIGAFEAKSAEKKVELTADDHYRIDEETDRKLREFNNRSPVGVESVSEEPSLLSSTIRLYTKQKHSTGS